MNKKMIALNELANEILEGKHDAPKGISTEMNVAAYSYLSAIQEATEKRKFDNLVQHFNESIPIHPKLMPFVASAIKTLLIGKKSGKPQKFTSIQGEAIKQDIQRRIDGQKISKSKAIEKEAERLGVDIKTIDRQLNKNKLSHKQ
ncbi:hypothetical protein [Polynucleobacter sp. MWH-HuK1]|uniref:hypothetical protein n=1 Tax=Polynucleobacter sp. MWH-HuK1 TaxID=1743158 RepID=UPI001C0BCAC3|nr:hypothetical protein [Polynucleobacter sp. MWH-HuK1]MBU3565988.1 hypothetical protein [Polynucleobacter sp. MWH-HuK1]